MNAEHTKILFETAPIFYSGRKESLIKNLMGFGFECGDGWFYPLKEFSENIECLNVLLKRWGVYIKAIQIKEKFGTLRVYFNVMCKLSLWKRILNWILLGGSRLVFWKKIIPYQFIESEKQYTISKAIYNLVDKMVLDCENDCMNFCEICGKSFGSWNKKDKVETTGWIRIVCKECAEKNNWDYIPFKSELPTS